MGKKALSLWQAAPGPGRDTATKETTGLATLTQPGAEVQGGSQEPALPLIPRSGLSGQAEWPATYLGHDLGPGRRGEGAGTRLGVPVEQGWESFCSEPHAVRRPEFRGALRAHKGGACEHSPGLCGQDRTLILATLPEGLCLSISLFCLIWFWFGGYTQSCSDITYFCF